MTGAWGAAMIAPSSGTGPIDIGWAELAIASGLVLVAIALAAWQRLGLTRGFVVGAIRATVQLLAVGYVLAFLFTTRRWWLVLLALAVMLAAATWTAIDRQRGRPDRARLFAISGAAMVIGTGLTLAYVDVLVLHLRPWWEPQYVIPLFGMIVGNAMNGVALAVERLVSEMELRRGEVESYLALGASPERASAAAVRRALAAALIPAVNGLMVVGLVALPGMMTGQILAGSSPTTAVRYQIMVAFMLAGATATTAVAAVLWYRRTFFNAAEQLVAAREGPV